MVIDILTTYETHDSSSSWCCLRGFEQTFVHKAAYLAGVDDVGDVHAERTSVDVLATVGDGDVIVARGGREVLD